MRTYLLLIFTMAFSYFGKSQNFDSVFDHSNILNVGYAKESKPISTITILNDNKQQEDIEVRCICQKNVKENKIAIQASKIFPSDSYKPAYLKEAKTFMNSFSMNYAWYKDSLDFQVSQITIYLTDSKVDSTIIKRVSEEPQFDGKYKISASIDYFNISITKTNYNVASDIWGVAKLKMPIPFGWTEHDKTVNLYFRCNNSRIDQTVELPSFDDGHYPHGKN